MEKYEALEKLEEAKELLSKAIDLVSEVFAGDSHTQAYWIEQVQEQLCKGNPYNTDLDDLVKQVEDGECQNVDYHEYGDLSENEPYPKTNADDDTDEALEAAQYNYDNFIRDLKEKDFWCKCGNGKDYVGEMAYYRDRKTGCHGWMCVDCKKVIQIG